MELIPLSESVVKLSAVCMNCRSEAAFTRRLGDETKVIFTANPKCTARYQNNPHTV